MVALHGHEAGNGGHSQEATYRHRAHTCSRASLDAPSTPTGRGKPWTRGASDRVGEPTQRRQQEARQTSMGKGEIMDDANADAPLRSATLPASAQGQAFPAISDDSVSRRKCV